MALTTRPLSPHLLSFIITLAGASSCGSSSPNTANYDGASDSNAGDGSNAGVNDPSPANDAVVVDAVFTSELECSAESTGTITMRNTGTTTWTRATGYKLGSVDDDDPFVTGDVRVWLSKDDVVPPGGEHSFLIPMKAGDEAGFYLTDWQMVHEGKQWFGESSTTNIEVVCEEENYPLPLPDMSSTVQAVAAAHPDLLADSCHLDGGSWAFMDTLVDELRLTDKRWGYNWKRGVIGDPSRDVVDYHYGPGEPEESPDVYIIDVIVGHCGPNPAPGWLDQTKATLDAGEIGRWTGRGRF